MSSESQRSIEDEWVDTVVPEELDWRELVREYPLASMGVVATVGFLVGRFQGDRILALAREVVHQRVDQSLESYGLFVGGRGASGKGSRGSDSGGRE